MINGRQIMTMCIYISVGRDVRKKLLCDFCAKIDSFAEIDCLGSNNWKIMGFIFFEPLTQFFGLLMKTTPILCIFDIVNIYKVILPDRTICLPCILQFRCRF